MKRRLVPFIFSCSLCEQFDTEEAAYQQQVMMDANLAASVAKAHEMSDSEPDSDSTIEPPDYSSSLDGSQDLFDTTSGSSSFRSKLGSSSSSPGTARYRPSSKTLSKNISKTHEISDSDSDSAEDAKRPKLAVDWQGRKSLTLPPSSSSSIGATLSHVHRPKSSPLSSQSSSCISQDQMRQTKITNLSPKLSVNVASSFSKRSTTKSGSNTKLSSLKVSASSVSGMEQSGGGRDETSGSKPVCKYGDRCFRTNPDHFQDFHHEGLSIDRFKWVGFSDDCAFSH